MNSLGKFGKLENFHKENTQVKYLVKAGEREDLPQSECEKFANKLSINAVLWE